MDNYHRYLNFPELVPNNDVLQFISEMGITEADAKRLIHVGVGYLKVPIDKLPKSFTEWFESAFDNLCIGDCEIFYTPPGAKHPPHSDGFYPFIDLVKINYVFDNNDAMMHWHQLPKDYVIDATYTGYKTTVTYVPESDTTIAHSAKIEKPSLVNVGVPHSVDNSSNEQGRWCICLFPNYKNVEGRVTKRVLFNEALEIFKGYVQ
jgi:hypothetical protein